MKHILKAAFCCMMVVMLASCNVATGITQEGMNGSLDTRIDISDFLQDVIREQMTLLNGEKGGDMIARNLIGFTRSIQKTGTVKNMRLSKTSCDSYRVMFDYDDLEKLFSALNRPYDVSSILKITDTGLRFHLDIENYSELESLIPLLGDPNIEVYGPKYNQGLSEEEYKEMLMYLLGEEAPEMLDSSIVSIIMNTPEDVTYCSGCIKMESRTIFYEIPLIKILLLNEPLDFIVGWNPGT